MQSFTTLSQIREFESFLQGGVPEGVDSVYGRDSQKFSESHCRGGEAQVGYNLGSGKNDEIILGHLQFDPSTGEEKIEITI